MRVFSITIPIAGHAFMEVEAENEAAAIEKALETVTMDNIDMWEPLEQFNQGNVCYCPQPWNVVAKDEGPVE